MIEKIKVCTKCDKGLNINCFVKDKSKKDGLRSNCKDCKKLGDVKYRKENRGKVLLKMAEYRSNHREELAFNERERQKNFSDEERIEYNRKKLVYIKKNPKQRQEVVAIDFANGKVKKLDVEGKLIVKQWRDLKTKYNYMCLCCKLQESEISLTVDHIIPFSKGGLNIVDNIQPLCVCCNKIKYNKIVDYTKEVCYAENSN